MSSAVLPRMVTRAELQKAFPTHNLVYTFENLLMWSQGAAPDLTALMAQVAANTAAINANSAAIIANADEALALTYLHMGA